MLDAEIAKAEADARKAAAEALSTEIGLLPKEVTAGSFTAPTAAPPLATVAAYRSVGEVGQAVAARLPASKTVWLVPDGSFQSAIDTHLAVTAELKRLTELAQKATEYVSTRPAELAPALALAAAAAPVLMSLFSTSRTVTSADVAVGFSPLAATVSAAAETPLVYIWGLTPPPATNLGVEGLENARDNLDIALMDARSTSAATPEEETAKSEAEVWKAVLTELAKKDELD
ncbi:MAG TPA: hypothetical protein VHS28_04720, partial [Chloroflexota bacterium]|nr:hypothetical protein [Chloroflexota bacterium]